MPPLHPLYLAWVAEPVADGEIRPRAPLHLTLVPPFAADEADALDAMRETAAGLAPVPARTAGRERLGPRGDVPVLLVEPVAPLRDLNVRLMDALRARGVDLDHARHVGEGFRPHLSVRRPTPAAARLDGGGAFTVDHVALLRRDAGGTTVVARAPLGRLSRVFVEDFDGPGLDTSVWLPHYLPAWSSRTETAAAFEVADSCLRLSIPPGQGLWMGADHEPPLRVSGVQTGNFSGPVGSRIGQQPLPGGSVVREEQPRFEGFLPRFGRLSMRARMTLSPRSMAAWWMVGFEDRPERSAEICVFEVFGDAVEAGRSAAVGMGLHPFRDPRIADDFAAVRLSLDVARFHDYAVRWTPQEAVFAVDGAEVRRCRRPPDYPMQMMVAVFDFPDRSVGADDHLVPELVVDRLSWSPLPGPAG